jgi:uncharacterized repeat protein (TIGR03803 family)
MRGKGLSTGLRATLLVIVAVTLVVTNTYAGTEKVLFDFGAQFTDAYTPYGSLISDAHGNLYGTSGAGGASGQGTVFKLTKKAGVWTDMVLYSFNQNGIDGINPQAGVIFDAAGNLYGTTVHGGTFGGGTVFELSPAGGGNWTEKVLHNFSYSNDHKDGANPYAGLIFDAARKNLYGTTADGGVNGAGVVFELTPTKGGGKEKVLHSFNVSDGNGPFGGLTFDTHGNLYGTTYYGGAHGYGVVFELTPKAGGGWKEKVLHSFNSNGHDGFYPYTSVILDGAGNIYGTTLEGGSHGFGSVFELAPKVGGGWTKTSLHDFASNGKDGTYPRGGLIDSAGNLYGTTTSGGLGEGIVFELAPKVGGGWKEKVLYSFGSQSLDGYAPQCSLIRDSAGNLFGTGPQGGTHGGGTVFKVTP